jgi:hypothetical protein
MNKPSSLAVVLVLSPDSSGRYSYSYSKIGCEGNHEYEYEYEYHFIEYEYEYHFIEYKFEYEYHREFIVDLGYAGVHRRVSRSLMRLAIPRV